MISQDSAAIRILGVASMLAVTFALSACGEYSPIDNGTTQTPTDGATGSATPQTTDQTPTPEITHEEEEETISYAWGLPPSDTSVQGNDGPGYGALLESCDSAQRFLDDNTVEQWFWGFTNPRYVVLYMAGIEQCRGNAARAAELTTGAMASYGTQGLDRATEPNDPVTGEPLSTPLPPGYGEPECDLYRSLVSVRDQVSPDSLTCPAGNKPSFTSRRWPVTDVDSIEFEVEVWDDPCTFDVIESETAPTEPVYPPTSYCGPEHPGVSTPISDAGGGG